jgi:Coenzyme PQQ synthesis protein D (PqqD)
VLARPDVHSLFILNRTAAALWSYIESGCSYTEAASRFADEYCIPLAKAQQDLDATLDAWSHHLLRPVADSPVLSSNALALPAVWHSTETYCINGRGIRVSVNGQELGEEISPRLESLQSADIGEPDLEFYVWSEGGRVHLWHSGELVSSEENPNAIRAILLQEMVRRTERGREWLGILHAGACGNDDHCVLLAGASYSGKTTLSAALMGSGLKLYCDDSAAIGKYNYAVSPMPFRMMVREGSWQVLAARFPELISSPAFERYGQQVRFLSPGPAQVATSATVARSLFFISYSPGEKISLRPILPIEALIRLRDSGFWVRHERAEISHFLGWLQGLPAFVLTYSDLDEAVKKIREAADL